MCNSRSNKLLHPPPSTFTTGFLRLLNRGPTKNPQHRLVKALMTLRTSKMHPLIYVQNMSTRLKSARPIRIRPLTLHHSLGNTRRRAGGRGPIPTHAMIDRNITTSRIRPAVLTVDSGIRARLRLIAVVSDMALLGQSHVTEIRPVRKRDDGRVVRRSESVRRAREKREVGSRRHAALVHALTAKMRRRTKKDLRTHNFLAYCKPVMC